MLDRYTITLQPDELALVLGVEVPDSYTAQYNAAPTKSLPTILNISQDKISFLNWGLMAMWSNNKTMSRSSSISLSALVLTKSSYKKKLITHRCVIPWMDFISGRKWPRSSRSRITSFFPISAYSVWQAYGKENEDENSFIMITRPSNEYVGSFQEDMPLIMDVGSTKKWLETESSEELETLLTKSSDEKLLPTR